MYLPHIRKQQKDAANTWLKSCFRYHAEKIVRSASKQMESSDPKGKLRRTFECGSIRTRLKFDFILQKISYATYRVTTSQYPHQICQRQTNWFKISRTMTCRPMRQHPNWERLSKAWLTIQSETNLQFIIDTLPSTKHFHFADISIWRYRRWIHWTSVTEIWSDFCTKISQAIHNERLCVERRMGVPVREPYKLR